MSPLEFTVFLVQRMFSCSVSRLQAGRLVAIVICGPNNTLKV